MSADQNQTVVESSLSPKTLQSVCSVVQHHEENQPQMSESDPGFASQSVNQELLEEQQKSEMGRDAWQPAQYLMSQRSPQELQVKQLQRVLQEQNTLLSLISPGQILSPTFLAHWQVQTSLSFSDADPLNPAGNLDAFKECPTKATYSGEVENESEALATNNTNVQDRIQQTVQIRETDKPVVQFNDSNFFLFHHKPTYFQLHCSCNGIWQEANCEDENHRSDEEHRFAEFSLVAHRLLFKSSDNPY
ncbi:hypothetical protein Q8A67_017565 [Cirrhinus molitorella]|uniref:Uncharacterized protein n=1 Tax=Cirrhinus molitorella TaxID=172907 RepID=A0AA88TH64_9TELE|nr:hypothetical protein Q8A67_017565 [Cirrhinus molitorella]